MKKQRAPALYAGGQRFKSSSAHHSQADHRILKIFQESGYRSTRSTDTLILILGEIVNPYY
jgi:hypothetical protein